MSETSDFNVRLRLLNRQWGRRLSSVRGDLTGLGSHATRISRNVARATGRALDRLATPSTLLSTLGIGTAARQLVGFERRLRAVQVNANASYQEIEELRDRLRDLSGAKTGQFAEELLGAAEVLLAKDSNLSGTLLDTNLLQEIGRVATATGADIKDVAETAFQLNNAFDIPWSQVGDGLATAVALGKEGAFELRDMAQFLPEIAAGMARVGQTGARGLARSAAMLQVLRARTGSAAAAATNLENVLGFLGSEQASKRLNKRGIKVFNKDGTMRDLFEILAEIRKVTDGGKNAQAIGSIFTDKQARDGIAALLQDFERLQRLSQLTNAGAIVDKDFATTSQSAAAAMKSLVAELSKLADRHLTPWLERMTSFLQFLNAHPGMLEKALGLGGVVVALAGVRKLLRVFNLPGGGGGGGAAGGGGLIPGGMPVHVTNWPTSLGPSVGAGAGGAAQAAKTGIPFIKKVGGLLRGGLAALGGFGLRALGALGLGGLAKTLAGGVAGAGGGLVAGTVGAGAALGGLIGTGINKFLLPEGFKTAMQNAMAYALSPFSDSAKDLVRELRADRERQRILKLELDTDTLAVDMARG